MNIRKIAIIGPESTGKSTLSAQLADALHTVWVPEYAREYLQQLKRSYKQPDLLEIARGQLKLESACAKKATKYLICDTDLQVIKVWSEHKYGDCDPEILKAIKTRKYDLYLLTDIDLPWIDDPLREHGDPAMRQHFFDTYHRICLKSGVPFSVISGDYDERLQRALNVVKAIGK